MDDTEPYSYRADGMFSQFGINFPSLDATIISTAAIPCEDEARAAIWAFFPAAFADENGNGVEVDTSSVNRPVASKHSVTESRLIGKTIKVRKKDTAQHYRYAREYASARRYVYDVRQSRKH